MPSGIYNRTGKNNSGCFKKGFSPWNKGLKGCNEETLAGFQKGHQDFVPKESRGCSDITKNKIRVANTGKKPSLKTRKKMSEARRGEQLYNWKGNTPLKEQIRKCFEYRQWRSDIFTRDDFTCQECFIRGGDLEAHHNIKEFYQIIEGNNIKTMEEAKKCEELWNINNGITLCKKCHNKTKADKYLKEKLISSG